MIAVTIAIPVLKKFSTPKFKILNMFEHHEHVNIFTT